MSQKSQHHVSYFYKNRKVFEKKAAYFATSLPSRSRYLRGT